jgi:hypothetical protein
MAPLLRTYFNPSHRSFLTTLFTATFLGSVLVVAFPCPVREGDPSRREAFAEDGGVRSRTREEIIVMMNGRGKRRFMEEE